MMANPERPMLKFRFRWRADGKEHESIIEAHTHGDACYILGAEHVARMIVRRQKKISPDFELDLTTPDIVP